MSMGWQCPVCGVGVAPQLALCPMCGGNFVPAIIQTPDKPLDSVAPLTTSEGVAPLTTNNPVVFLVKDDLYWEMKAWEVSTFTDGLEHWQ